jgi:cysteine desulfurase family protein (TIGR01976 family)
VSLPVAEIRKVFPALHERDTVFFDNAAGAQAPRVVLDAVAEHLLRRNVQRGGAYAQSREVDATIARARESVATFLNALDPQEVCFGMNATSFIRLVSQAMGQIIRRRGGRREIIVTDLDHDSNVATWLALRPDGAHIVWWRMRKDGRLHPEDLDASLSRRTRLVACTLASNCVGSILDAAEVSRRAHAVGAEVFLDAVHYGAHGPLDIQELGCDYLVSSGYKTFAPHMGFLWGRKHLLDALPTFREDFIPDQAPWKFEVGTYVYENVAGMDAAVGYLESLGTGKNRRSRLVSAMNSIRDYEASLSIALLNALASIPGVTVYGIADPSLVRFRTPTVAFNVKGTSARKVAERLAAANIAVRDGNMYTPRLMKRLNQTAAVRVSLVHYNTLEEIDRFAVSLARLARRPPASRRSGAGAG